MDFSNVIVQEAGELVEGEAEAIAFTTGDATAAVPVSPRAKPPIWDEVGAIQLHYIASTFHHLMFHVAIIGLQTE